jgi:hypothetical protein
MEASEYASALTSMRRQLLTKAIGEAGDASPEAVFSRLSAYAGSKSSADINRLRLARGAMGPDAWNDFGEPLIGRMGMAPDGAFSADRFVTAFGNMSPAAKQTIFNPEQLKALTDLNTVSDLIKDRITRLSNPSGTGRTLFTGGMFWGAFGEPITWTLSMLGTRLAASAMSRPAEVRRAAVALSAQARSNFATLGQAAVRAGALETTRRANREPNSTMDFSARAQEQ